MERTNQYVNYVGCSAMWAQILYSVAPTKAICEQPVTNHHLGKNRNNNNQSIKSINGFALTAIKLSFNYIALPIYPK